MQGATPRHSAIYGQLAGECTPKSFDLIRRQHGWWTKLLPEQPRMYLTLTNSLRRLNFASCRIDLHLFDRDRTIGINGFHFEKKRIQVRRAPPDEQISPGTVEPFRDRRAIQLHNPLFDDPARARVKRIRYLNNQRLIANQALDHDLLADTEPAEVARDIIAQ